MNLITKILFIIFLALSQTGHAKIIEKVVDLPVEVKNIYGQTFKQTIKVTIFMENTKSALSPFMILNHGRAAHEADRIKLGRAKYTENAKYFVSKGFIVFVPTRVGYGVSGGNDVEYSGDCNFRDYPPAYEAAAQQTLKVIDYAKSLIYVNPNKGVVVGQSFGGATAIAVAAKNIPGVIGAVNFAGGGGGNPETRPGNPCRPDLMKKLFEQYGGSTKIPTLWLYSENDKYFGKNYPQEWFKGFADKGGVGKFIQLPPLPSVLGEDGHATFTRNPEAWRPVFEEFLKSLGW